MATPTAPTAPAAPENGAEKRPGEPLEGTSAAKKPRATPPSWPERGRKFGPTVNILDKIKVIFDNGRALALEEDALREESEQEVIDWFLTLKEPARRQLFTYRILERDYLQPHAPDAFTSVKVWDGIAAQLNAGVAAEKTDNTKNLKENCINWIIQDLDKPEEKLDPPLKPNVKSTRGFHHHATGRMLCPSDIVYNNDSRLELQNKTSKNNGVKGSEWPRFLWKGEKCNDKDFWDGFLRDEFLVKGWKSVFTTPSSANDDDGDTVPTRDGKAKLRGINEVTVGSIVYIATMLRFSISSFSAFAMSDKSQDSETFYATLYDLLIDPREKENVDKLLKWWNGRIFGTRTASTGTSTGTRAKFAAQRAAPAAA